METQMETLKVTLKLKDLSSETQTVTLKVTQKQKGSS